MIIKVDLGKSSYDILLERGALKRAEKELNLGRKVLIVTDNGVPPEYADALSQKCKKPYIFTVNQGEESKSTAVWEKLLTKMLQAGFTRTDCVVAVGGGVVGDLAGFTAASFMRGIDFYNVPTTLLSQVDSSIGGKTAVNFGGIKNIVGAFYQPKKVIIDADVLKTLNPRQISNGLAESIKMAACFDKNMFEMLENEDISGNLEKKIQHSLEIKRNVVQQDEKEKGLRKALNFGHTIAHGIEVQGGLYHGECVALGMLPMCSPEVRERLESVLVKAGLPIKCNKDAEKIIEAVSHDKKMDGATLNTVFVPEIGRFEFRQTTLEDFSKLVRENF